MGKWRIGDKWFGNQCVQVWPIFIVLIIRLIYVTLWNYIGHLLGGSQTLSTGFWIGLVLIAQLKEPNDYENKIE